ncbi:MAG: hypothetical protein ACETWQ_10085, partial [Phycisphaerae bacterium]
QDRDPKLSWQRSVSDCLSGQFGKLAERNFQLVGVFFFDVQPRIPWYGDPTIVQTNLYDGMASSIFVGGVGL